MDVLILFPLYWVDEWIWKNVTTPFLLVPWYIADSMALVAYSVLLHGLFGQTLGKRLTNVKVFDVSGGSLTLKQAALRDCVSIAFVIYGLAIDLPSVLAGSTPYATANEFTPAVQLAMYAGFAWFALELVTMLFNSKRRAIHDFIAGSVVMRVDSTLLNESEPASNPVQS